MTPTIYDSHNITCAQSLIYRNPETDFTVAYNPNCTPPPLANACLERSSMVRPGHFFVIDDLDGKPAIRFALGIGR